MLYAYLAAFGCALAYGIGSVLQDVGARKGRAGDRIDAKGLVKVATDLPYLGGLGLDGVGWVLSLIALQSLPLFAVQAISASSIAVTVLLAALLLGSRPTGRQVVAMAVLGVGLVALALSAAPDDPRRVGTRFAVGMWLAVAVVAGLGVLAPRVARGDRAAVLLGAVSGLGYGGTAICARALEADGALLNVLKDPLTWALVAHGALGIAFFAAALERGSVSVATASQYGAEVLVPSLVGLVFLGDRAREGRVALAAAGFLLTLAGAVSLALASPEEEAEGAVAGAPAS